MLRSLSERDALVANHVIYHTEVQFGLRRICLGIINPVAVFRLAGFLQRQIAVGRDDINLLISVGLRCREPDSDLFPSGKIPDREGVLKREMARILGKGGQS